MEPFPSTLIVSMNVKILVPKGRSCGDAEAGAVHQYDVDAAQVTVAQIMNHFSEETRIPVYGQRFIIGGKKITAASDGAATLLEAAVVTERKMPGGAVVRRVDKALLAQIAKKKLIQATLMGTPRSAQLEDLDSCGDALGCVFCFLSIDDLRLMQFVSKAWFRIIDAHSRHVPQRYCLVGMDINAQCGMISTALLRAHADDGAAAAGHRALMMNAIRQLYSCFDLLRGVVKYTMPHPLVQNSFVGNIGRTAYRTNAACTVGSNGASSVAFMHVAYAYDDDGFDGVAAFDVVAGKTRWMRNVGEFASDAMRASAQAQAARERLADQAAMQSRIDAIIRE